MNVAARWIACVVVAGSACVGGCAVDGGGSEGGVEARASAAPGESRAMASGFGPELKGRAARRTGPTDSVPSAYLEKQLFSEGVDVSTPHHQEVKVVGADADYSVVLGPYPSGSGTGEGKFDLGAMPAYEMEVGYAALWGRRPRVVTTRVATGSMGVSAPPGSPPPPLPVHPALAVWNDPVGQREVIVKIGLPGMTTAVVEVIANAGTAKAIVGDDQFVVATGAGNDVTISPPASVNDAPDVLEFYKFARGKLQEAALIPR